MPTLILLNVLILSSPFSCIKHQIGELIDRPVGSKLTYLNTSSTPSTMIELHGAHAILRCEGEMYTAYLLENK